MRTTVMLKVIDHNNFLAQFCHLSAESLILGVYDPRFLGLGSLFARHSIDRPYMVAYISAPLTTNVYLAPVKSY